MVSTSPITSLDILTVEHLSCCNFCLVLDLNAIFIALGIFLHDHGVGAGRDRGAGHDPDGGAGCDLAGVDVPGRDLADDAQATGGGGRP